MQGEAAPTHVDGLRVVKEIDVFISNGSLGQGSELYDVQYPLRPAWRGYRIQELDKVKIKPKARRIEFEVPTGADPRNVDDRHPRMAARGHNMVLRSQYSKPEETYAVGFLDQAEGQPERLYLMPLDHCVQMRPSFQYLEKEEGAAGGRGRGRAGARGDREEVATSGAAESAAAAAAAAAAGGAGPSKEEKKPEAVAVQVQVKKRETERQLELRLNSYAHIKQQEDEEAWRDLEFCLGREGYRGAMQHATAKAQAHAQPAYAPVPATAYTNDLAPILFSQFSGSGAPHEGPGAAPGPNSLTPELRGRSAGAGPSASAPPTALSAQDRAAIQKLVGRELEKCGVMSLGNIRDALGGTADEGLKALGADRMQDRVLSEILLDKGSNIICIRRSYLLQRLNNPSIDPFRDLVIELLRDKADGVRKNDVKDVAATKNLEVNDTLYSRVMKELCTSRGAIWSLKTGST